MEPQWSIFSTVSRHTPVGTLVALGRWWARHPAEGARWLGYLCAATDALHTVPLLCAMDACAKSTAEGARVVRHAFRTMLRHRADLNMDTPRVEATVLLWCALGVLPAGEAASPFALGSADAGDDNPQLCHTCEHCPAAFATETRLGAHLDAHCRALLHAKFGRPGPPARASAFARHGASVEPPPPPQLHPSPIPAAIQPARGCCVCADALRVEWVDALQAWCFVDGVQVASGGVVHAECAGNVA